MTHRKR